MPKIIFLIFLLALIVRFLYFPSNINFAYDQARDSFVSLGILKGDFKILGPPTTAGDTIFHGALIYYVLAPIYFLSGNNPEVAAAVFRIINAVGLLLVFYIGSLIFNRFVGIISAVLFAVSFEQSQYSLFFGHPALGAFTILIFYFGLALWIFKNRAMGFVIALFGLGLTIQFEDANIPLILIFVLYLILFKNKLKLLTLKTLVFGLLAISLTLSTFILSEIKYEFRMSRAILSVIFKLTERSAGNYGNILAVSERFIHDNFLANQTLVPFVLLILVISTLFLFKKQKQQVIFLLLWFSGGISTHFLNPSFTYYYSPGATVALLIFVATLIDVLFQKQKFLAVAVLGLIIFSNLSLVINENYKGANKDMVIQPGMLTVSQRKTVEYIYQKAEGQPFSINALTIPLNVKTTWDYLFNWYGKDKYVYLPVWGGEAADGYPGNLQVITDRSKLPNKRFTIIEPTIGMGQRQIDDFFRVENYFTKVIEEKTFGTIIVQMREKI
jgi:hypothetical protein